MSVAEQIQITSSLEASKLKVVLKFLGGWGGVSFSLGFLFVWGFFSPN